MHKKLLFISTSLIALSIIISFMLAIYKDTLAYQELSETNMESTISLANIDISKNIENTMALPVTVSQTMANDSFLISWAEDELQNTDDDDYEDDLIQYLNAYKDKYDYSTVFFVSAQTDIYYYQDGINKTISEDNEHDVWYYNFIESEKEYDLEIDTNESDSDSISVFVNFRVEDDNGNLLGVIGVGEEVESIETTIEEYEDDYDLNIYIINSGGATTSFSGDTSVFIQEDDLSSVLDIDQDITLSEDDDSTITWYSTAEKRVCITTQYNSDLDWYLIIETDTSSLDQIFINNLFDNAFYLMLSLIVCITCTLIIFHFYSHKISKLENIDELTTLFNKKIFMKMLRKSIGAKRTPAKTIFMFDVDYFKQINDTKGHLYGNEVLQYIGKKISDYTKSKGMVSRWGGDEFLGYFTVDINEAENILKLFLEEANNSIYEIQLSIGLISVNTDNPIEKLIQDVDDALYESKRNGRNRITVNNSDK